MNTVQDTVDAQIGDLLLWKDPNIRKIVEQTAAGHQVPLQAFGALLAWERDNQKKKTKYGMREAFDEVFNHRQLWGK